MTSNNALRREGSVLLWTLFTLTVLSLVCGVLLYVVSQNMVAGSQAATWQQALTGAETGVDAAIRALNTKTWTRWVQGNGSPPSTEPSPIPSNTPGTSSVGPSLTQYYYLPSTALTVNFPNTEGASSVSTWVTIDTAGMLTTQDTNGKQWYRIRATGFAAMPGPPRVSMNRLDNELRNTVGLRFNRKTNTAYNSTNFGPTRTIEVIVAPVASGGWGRGITLKNWIVQSGSGSIDSFDSSDPFKSSTITINGVSVSGQYDVAKRQNHGDVGTQDSNSSDIHSTYIYGTLTYTGTVAPKNVGHVSNVTSPFTSTISTVSAPSWSGITPTSLSSGAGTITAGPTGAPTYYKVNGDFTVSGSQVLNVVTDGSGSSNQQIYIWVTGKLTTSGSSKIAEAAGLKATWYVGGDITISGDSYQNGSGLAANLEINGYGGNNKFTDSGSANFVGVVNAPNYDATISGSGSFMGALIADTLTISGSASFHYDEALNLGGSPNIGNYAFASWFEDNSDATHKVKDNNAVVHPILY